jgi:GH24 family phage-related lysozyme (muramidase)
MQISQVGIRLIKSFEPVSYTAHQDATGTWMIGYRHTDGVTEGMTITPEDAEECLTYSLAEIARHVESYVTVPLTQHQFDALVALSFDLGTETLRQSIMLSLLNAGQYLAAADAILEFGEAGLRRRQAERFLFMMRDEKISWWENLMAWIRQ